MEIVRIKGIDFNTKDLVGLHTNRADKDFLNLGKIIVSPPGVRDTFVGSLGISTRKICEIEIFYRHNDEWGKDLDLAISAGPESLVDRYLFFGGNIIELNRKYKELFGERRI